MIPFTCPCCEVSHPPHRDGCSFHNDCPTDAETFDEVSALRSEVARLREERRGWLTSDEREALEDAADAAEAWGSEPTARVIRALLARETPPMVKMPPASTGETPLVRDLMWGEAIRAAGGEVCE